MKWYNKLENIFVFCPGREKEKKLSQQGSSLVILKIE
jgi:hypothetical protein